MKKVILSAAFLIALILTTGISYGQSVVKETRDVRNFTKVSFGVSGNLYIKLGSEFRVEIEGDRRVLNEIATEVSGGRLIIKQENWRFNFKDERVTINITMPEIEGLSVSGSGRAEIMDAVNSDDLNLSVSGSGKLITRGMEVDDLSCGISGSGDILLEGNGKVDRATIAISGSGGFQGESIEIDHLKISISGSGNCYCKVGDSLDASISGSGNVTYLGDPRVNARVSGSGHVRSK
ncbi:MAG TPA: head GIN domain-containing protein [Bacteroidales bacterium]|nr:head GIN domain-containing protein [Bacteroidales bacterium]